MYAILRHRAAIKAWCWHVCFSRSGKMYSKSFYDQVCGGAKQAKAQAIAWRDDQLRKLEDFTLLDFHKQKRSNNVSGVAGVHFLKTPRQPLGFWQAKIKPHNGKSMTKPKPKPFSVHLHGDKEAFDLAVAARDELLKKVKDRLYLQHPVAKKLSGEGTS